VTDISATDAARRFSDLLDDVEHRGDQFTIVRRGKAVATISPVRRGKGSDVKALLRTHRPDAAWRADLDEVRDLLEVEERP